MKRLCTIFAALPAAIVAAAAPQAAVTNLTQSADRTVTVSYALSGAPAVVSAWPCSALTCVASWAASLS